MWDTIIKILNVGVFGILSVSNGTGRLAAFYIVLGALLCIVSGYLLGSFNPAIYFSKKLFGGDIRKEGSGNAGMTNMLRTHGKKAGILTALCDLGKTVAACFLGYIFLGYEGAALAGFFTMLGHIAPVFYGFKGGKGIMVTAGTLLCLDPIVFLITIAIFALVFYISKTVSIASIMAGLVYPFIFLRVGGHYGLAGVCAIITTFIILFTHRQNIKRILDGTEPKTTIGGRKKKAEEVESAPAEGAAEQPEAEEPQEAERTGKINPNTSKKKAKRRK